MKITFTQLEKRLNGSKYWLAKPNFMPEPGALNYNITLTRRAWNDMDDWCVSMFGERPMNVWPQAGDRWFANDSAFWFRDESDCLLFLLRWS